MTTSERQEWRAFLRAALPNTPRNRLRVEHTGLWQSQAIGWNEGWDRVERFPTPPIQDPPGHDNDLYPYMYCAPATATYWIDKDLARKRSRELFVALTSDKSVR